MVSKKAFTLAEIMIVLMIIGILTLIIMPILTANFQRAHFKSAYKRAFNIMATLTSIEISQGNFPFMSPDGTQQGYLKQMHDSFLHNTNFKDYYDEDSDQVLHELPEEPNFLNLWINTEDGLSYKIQGEMTTNAKKKAEINIYSTLEELAENSSYYVLVDLNGFKKGPNCEDPKISSGLEENEDYTLKCDRYPIFVGTDGVAAGNRTKTITGRITGESSL